MVEELTGRIEEILAMNISGVLLHNLSEKALPLIFAMSTVHSERGRDCGS